MPKLDKKTAAAVAEQESQSFEPIPDGIYTAKLLSVEARESRAGNPMWTWELEIDEGDHKGRRQWVNTSLSENAQWKMKEVFDAFGYTTDSDTDEMVGDRIKIAVSTRVIESGSRAGQKGNNVDRCLPLGDSDDDDDDDAF